MIKRAAVLALGLAAMAAPALAAEDGPLVTSDGGPGAYSLDDQIAAWRAAGDPPPGAGPVAIAPRPDRRPHGMVSVGIGTGGYRSVEGVVTLPIGEAGSLTLAVANARGRGLWMRGPGLHPAPGFAGASGPLLVPPP